MPETSFPYAGGQGMTDAAYERLMARVSGTGRIDLEVPGNALTTPIVYADGSGRQFKVRANAAYLVRGFRWESGAEGIVKALDANTSGNPRLDLVVLRLSRADFTVRLAVLKGTPAATPTLPALTQGYDTGSSSSRYEIPLASIRVAHNTSATGPTIASMDVSIYESWLAEPNLIGHSFARPAVKPGALWTEYDTAKTFVGLQSKWHLVGEDGGYVKMTNANSTIWDPDRYYVYWQRRNGFVYFQALVYRKTGAADAAAGSDIPIVYLPQAALPVISSYYGTCVMGGNTVCRFYLNGTTGEMTLIDHAVLKAGNFVHVGPVMWPAKNL